MTGDHVPAGTVPDFYSGRLPSVPDTIGKLIAGKAFRMDDTGMSGSRIMIFDEMVLKVVPYRDENADTVRVMRWLQDKLPVPRVICDEKYSGFQYLLMSKIPGKMCCDASLMAHPQELVDLLAEALRMLWKTDITGCPRHRTIDRELAEARRRVENHLVDQDNAEPETFGEGGFRNPEELLGWLETHRPGYEPVLSHGDFCLPNIFVDRGRVSGFIDLGDTGVGDKWRDIALCYRSLKHNYDGTYGGRVYPDFCPDMLFEALGIAPDWNKIRYYILMDELF